MGANHTPLRVEVHLAEPVTTSAYPRLLDGLLAKCVTEDSLLLADEDDPRPLRVLAQELPLEHAIWGSHKVWKASAFMPKGRITSSGSIDPLSCSGATESRRLTRKTDVFDFAAALQSGVVKTRGFDPEDFGPYDMVLDTSRGLLKNCLLIYSLKHVRCLEAWCVGDERTIGELLREHVQFFGAKRRLGHGRVKKIEVVPDCRASALWELRPLPALAGPSSHPFGETIPVSMPATAPYWAAEQVIQQQMPIAAIW